jgi:hypothetical protein
LQDNIRPLPFALDFFGCLSMVSLALFIASRRGTKVTQPATRSDA